MKDRQGNSRYPSSRHPSAHHTDPTRDSWRALHSNDLSSHTGSPHEDRLPGPVLDFPSLSRALRKGPTRGRRLGTPNGRYPDTGNEGVRRGDRVVSVGPRSTPQGVEGSYNNSVGTTVVWKEERAVVEEVPWGHRRSHRGGGSGDGRFNHPLVIYVSLTEGRDVARSPVSSLSGGDGSLSSTTVSLVDGVKRLPRHLRGRPMYQTGVGVPESSDDVGVLTHLTSGRSVSLARPLARWDEGALVYTALLVDRGGARVTRGYPYTTHRTVCLSVSRRWWTPAKAPTPRQVSGPRRRYRQSPVKRPWSNREKG